MSIVPYNIPYYMTVNNGTVDTIINSQMSYAGVALAALNSYVGTMVDYATQDISVPIPAALAAGLDFDFSREAFDDLYTRKPASPTTTDISVSFASAPTMPTKPSSPAIDTITTGIPSSPSLPVKPDDLDIDDVAITLPVVPNLTVPNVSTIILSDLWNDIYEKLNSDITDGGYGIETADEIAIWERAKERELLELSAQTEDLDEMYAGFGYKFPPGALIKAKQKARQTYQNKLATLNRDMTIERLKLFVECRKFALENGVRFGQLFIEIGKLITALYDSEMKGAITEADINKTNNLVRVDEYKAKMEGYSTEAKVGAEIFDAEVKGSLAEMELVKSNNTSRIDKYKADMEGFSSEGKFLTDLFDSNIKAALGEADVKKSNNLVKLDKYKAEIDGYAAEARVLASLYDLASTQQDREIKAQVAVLQANIEIAKAYLTQAVEQAKLRLEGTKAASDVYKAICASALGTIHAQASLSGSFGVGYDYKKSESVNNSYQESATIA
jgi:hypothetical protein